MDSIASFFSAATNVHVDFQQFDVGTGQPVVSYPQLEFHPKNLFAFGSPIGLCNRYFFRSLYCYAT